ncbi:MAG: hypothetical protein ABI760_05305 [Ferruginibacter sp.]
MMKKQLANVFIPISKTEMDILVTDVKETLVKDFTNNKHRQFCVADLWNIHRNKKKVADRRFLV